MATAALNGIDSNTASQAQNQLTTWLLGSPGKGDMYVGRKFDFGMLRMTSALLSYFSNVLNSEWCLETQERSVCC